MSTNIFDNIDNILNAFANLASILLGIFIITQFVMWILKDGIQIALRRLLSLRIFLPIMLALGLQLLSSSAVFVPPEQVGVVVSAISPGGVRPHPLRGGLHWVVPFVETVDQYPIAWQTYTMSGKVDEGAKAGNDSIRARTSDGQEVFLDVSMIFRINADQIVLVHIDWQDRYISELIRPVTRGYVRTQVSQFKVTEVNSSARTDLESTLDRLIREELNTKGFILDQFLVRDITFSAEYAAAIEEKQVALEDQAKAIFRAEEARRLAEGDADAARIRAQGSADATLIQAEADAAATLVQAEADAAATVLQGDADATALNLISVPLSGREDLVTYRYVDRLAPGVQVMLLPNDNPFLLPLPELQPSNTLSTTTPVNNNLSDLQPTIAPE